MTWMHKLLIILVFFLVNISSCQAEIYKVEQTNGTTVYFTEDDYLEIQHVFTKEKNYTVLHINKNVPDILEANIIVDKTTKIPLTEIKDPALRKSATTSNSIDKWYVYNEADWQGLNSNQKLEYELKISDKKNIKSHCRISPEEFVEIGKIPVEKAHTYPATTYDVPTYQLFFPNKTYDQIKDAFCYNLNYHYDINKVMSGYYGYNRYARDDGNKSIGFRGDDSDVLNFCNFIETPEGTWLNYRAWLINEHTRKDSWTGMYVSTGTDYIPLSFTSSDKKPDKFDKYLLDTKKIIDQTYEDFYGLNAYGLNLRKKYMDANESWSKGPFTVQKVDTEQIPALIAIQPGDQIISINGIQTTTLHLYEFEDMIKMDMKRPILHLTLKRTDATLYECDIVPISTQPQNKSIDYAAINTKEDWLYYSKTNPLKFAKPYYDPFRIFDPYGAKSAIKAEKISL